MSECLKDLKRSAIRIIKDRKLLIPTLLSTYGAVQLGFSLRNCPNWFDILVFGLFVIYCVYEFFWKNGSVRKIFIGKISTILLIAIGLMACFGLKIEVFAAAGAFFILALLTELLAYYLKEHIFPNDLGWLSAEIAAFAFILGVIISVFLPATC